MKSIVRAVSLAAILSCVSGWCCGCSGIGYLVGGAIDGPQKDIVDTVYVIRGIDSSGEDVYLLDGEASATLLKEVTPGSERVAEVLTGYDTVRVEAIKADTVLALRREPADVGREGLLPGELVEVTIRDSASTQIRGSVFNVSRKNIVLQMGAQFRGFAFTSLNTIRLSNENVISARDLSFSHCLINVPGLFLGQEPSSKFIPLREVMQIRVSRPAGWGSARRTGVILGALVDFVVWFALLHSFIGGMQFGST